MYETRLLFLSQKAQLLKKSFLIILNEEYQSEE